MRAIPGLRPTDALRCGWGDSSSKWLASLRFIFDEESPHPQRPAS